MPPVTHTHALFADQSQSILANRMELSGQGRACNGSAEAAQRAVVYVIGEQPDLVAQQSSRRRVLSHPHGRCRICRWRVQRSMTSSPISSLFAKARPAVV